MALVTILSSLTRIFINKVIGMTNTHTLKKLTSWSMGEHSQLFMKGYRP